MTFSVLTQKEKRDRGRGLISGFGQFPGVTVCVYPHTVHLRQPEEPKQEPLSGWMCYTFVLAVPIVLCIVLHHCGTMMLPEPESTNKKMDGRQRLTSSTDVTNV